MSSTRNPPRLRRILHLEDNPVDRELVAFHLANHGVECDIHHAGDREGVIAAMAQGPWDAVITDYRLDDIDAPESVELVRRLLGDVPLVVVSGAVGESEAAAAVLAGADDFLSKEDIAGIGASLDRATRAAQVRRLRARAEAERDRLAEVLAMADELVAVSTPDGRVTYLNAAARSLMGVESGSTPAGIRLIDLFAPGDQLGLLPKILATVGAGGVWRGDLHLAGSSREVPCSATVAPHQTGDGGIAWLSLVARDLTAELLHRQELLRAKEEAEHAASAKSEFLATMSHEIRTPLNGVLGMASLLASTPLSTQQAEFVDTIRSSGQALLTVINDLLDMSRIEAGRLDIATEPCDLRTVAEDAVELLAPRAAQKGLRLRLWWPPRGPARLVGDAGRIRQVLLNLIGNALKFTEAGSITVTVGISALDDGRRLVRWSVADSGPGIAAADLAGLFRPFSQVDHGATRRHGGTGLGLAISKRLVELMGGSIGVDSQPGQGSTFWFELPLHPAPDGDHDQAAILLGRKVVVVDADHERGAHLAELLAHAGLAVTTANPADDHRASVGQAVVLGLEGRPADVRRWVSSARAAGASALWCLPLDLPSAGSGAEEAVCLPLPFRTQRLMDALQAALGGGHGRSADDDLPGLPRPPAGRSWRVLLAMPDDRARAEVQAVVARVGCQARCAGDGAEVLAHCAQEPLDLCLLGGPLAGQDLCAIAHQIRTTPGPNRLMPLVLIAPSDAQLDRRALLAAGVDDHLAHPWTARALATCLARWFSLANPGH